MILSILLTLAAVAYQTSAGYYGGIYDTAPHANTHTADIPIVQTVYAPSISSPPFVQDDDSFIATPAVHPSAYGHAIAYAAPVAQVVNPVTYAAPLAHTAPVVKAYRVVYGFGAGYPHIAK